MTNERKTCFCVRLLAAMLAMLPLGRPRQKTRYIRVRVDPSTPRPVPILHVRSA